MTLSHPINPTRSTWQDVWALVFTVGVFSAWVSPAWAQNRAADMAPKRGMTDFTARLQAQAIAESAQRAAQLRPSITGEHRDVPVPSVAAGALPTPAPAPALAPLPALAPSVAALWTPAVPAPQGSPVTTSPEMAIAQQIHQGLLRCELGTSVRVEADATRPGLFNVQGQGFRYRMYPVPTSTGALRLEDKTAGAVWLQLANKSMLMDQTKGRRMADACTHPAQEAYEQATKNNPPPALFDTWGMGRSLD